MRRNVVVTFLLSLLLYSCGSFKDIDVRDYRLTVLSGDIKYHEIFYNLVAEFNQKVGFKALTYVKDAKEANSFISLESGLHNDGGKVGLGQAQIDTVYNSAIYPKLLGNVETRHSMNLRLDKEFIDKNNGTDNQGYYEITKLFSHEVGHGLGLDHSPDVSNIMYYEISGQKNMESLYAYARKTIPH